MSCSEPITHAIGELDDLATKLEELVDDLLNAGDLPATVGEDSVRALLSATARLLTAHQEATGTEVREPLRPEVSITEAVELACTLLRARDLKPFDLALWFYRSR